MQQRLQRFPRRRVGKHPLAYCLAVHCARFPDGLGSEDPLELGYGGPAGLRQLVSDRVGVDQRGAQALELARRGALAAADAPGEADDEAHPAKRSTG
jgi:hypothetical protein